MPALDRPNTSQTTPASPEHAAAPEPLERILRVTRKAWAMGEAGPEARPEARREPRAVPRQEDSRQEDIDPPRTPRGGNRDGKGNGGNGAASRLHLARLAARALAAQIMAMQCRQAFVADPSVA